MRAIFSRSCLTMALLSLSVACAPGAPGEGDLPGPDAPSGQGGASGGGQGGQSGQAGSGSQGGQAGSGGSENQGGSGPGGQGGSGPGGGGFRVSGKVSQLAISSARATSASALAGEPEPEPKTVTHVLAVTPSSQSNGRVLSEVGEDGSFSLDLNPSQLWVLVFVDATKTGADMIAGVFRTDGVNTLAPMHEGGADLGTVEVADGVATAGMPYDAFLEALGLDPAAALLLGRHDDMCLRVVNPDIDGNGELDVLEKGKRFLLDFHVGFGLIKGGHEVGLDDMLGQFLPADLAIAYRRTGIYGAFSQSFASGDWQPSIWAEFDAPLTFAPPALPGSPPSPNRTASSLNADDLFVSGWGDMSTIGAMGVPGADLPQGTYRFGFSDKTLTFTNVATRSDAELGRAEDFLMPFLKFVPSDPNCQSDCAVASIEYEWRKRTESGWVTATKAEVDVITGEGGGYLSFRVDNDIEAIGGLMLPRAPVTGSLPWSSVRAEGGPGAAERVAAATTGRMCHVGLSYDDKLGMRYFGDVQNGPACSGAP